MFVFVAANLFLLGAEVASEWSSVRDGPPPEPATRLKRRLRRGLRGLVVRARSADAGAHAARTGDP